MHRVYRCRAPELGERFSATTDFAQAVRKPRPQQPFDM
jgi:hypothetical protein